MLIWSAFESTICNKQDWTKEHIKSKSVALVLENLLVQSVNQSTIAYFQVSLSPK